MAYQHKIDWSDPRKGSDLVSFTMEPVKSAVVDFQVQIEGELEEIINLAFRDPTRVLFMGVEPINKVGSRLSDRG